MVTAIERLITVGELVARGARVVKALRKDGNGEAAALLERECDMQCKRLIARIRRARASGARAKRRNRIGGRFS